jgi:hypothetical protein
MLQAKQRDWQRYVIAKFNLYGCASGAILFLSAVKLNPKNLVDEPMQSTIFDISIAYI